jgi:hypothetical protein
MHAVRASIATVAVVAQPWIVARLMSATNIIASFDGAEQRIHFCTLSFGILCHPLIEISFCVFRARSIAQPQNDRCA